MRVALAATLAALLVGAIGGSAWAQTSPVAQYRMEENGGTSLRDTSGNALHGTIYGNPSWVTGVSGLALSLNGSSQYAGVPNYALLNITNQITVAAWFKPTKTAAATQRIIVKAFMGSTDGYELSLASTTGKVFVRFNEKTYGGTAYRINSTTSYPLNGTAWMHAAATFDGTNIKLYINGMQEGASLAMPVPIGTNSNPLLIGRQPDDANPYYFQGAVDDARVYNTALGAAEIRALAGLSTYYTIAASAGSNGSISPTGTVYVVPGESQAFAIAANSGYTVENVLVDGSSVGVETGYTFSSVAANHTISATFKAVTTMHTITASAGTGGSISPSGDVSVPDGEGKNFTITPLSCYTIADVVVDETTHLGPVTNHSFTNVTADHTITASFTAKPPLTITASAGAGGSIDPSGEVSVNCGASQPFSVAANSGYRVADLLVDGGSVGPASGYTFTNVQAAHTIAASFALADQPVGEWRMEENGGGIIADATASHFDGTVVGTTTWGTAGIEGSYALGLEGLSQYAYVPHRTALNVTTGITVATWVKPGRVATQNLVSKSTNGGVNGYELCLAAASSGSGPNKAFFRINQVASGDTYRLNSTTLYSDHLNTWIHLAATYDGATMKLYFNGLLDNSLTAAVAIANNTLPVGIGAQVDAGNLGTRWLQGAIDDARLYNYAISASDVLALASPWTITASAGSNGSISPTGTTAVRHTADQSYALTADPGYYVEDVLVDGSSVGAVSGYTFSNVQANHTIAASFSSNAPPSQPTLAAPANGATGVALAPTLDVVPTDPDSPQLTVKFYGRPAGLESSLILLPDTQCYTGQVNGGTIAMFEAQTRWIVNNRVGRDIAAVGQLGDITETNVALEWGRADGAMTLLENPVATGLPDGIPYVMNIGNHDADGTLFNGYFGESRFSGRDYYGGHYGSDNSSSYILFSAAGRDFILVSLRYAPPPAVLAWADGVLAAHPDRLAIVDSHSILNTGNPASWTSEGQSIYDELKDRPNLILMVCGHMHGEGRRTDVYQGHSVTSLLSDYQGYTNGGNGYLRIMEFAPAANQVRVRTYSPCLDQWETDADSSSQFTLACDMSGSGAYELIGTVTGVASGTHATVNWPDLAANTQYEWYVTVSDGARTTTSTPTWTFTTAGGGAPPDPVADLAVAPLANGSGPGGTLKLQLSWTPPPQGGTAQVYRKAYGDYPRYREGVGAVPAVPATPAAAIAADWALTGVTASGQSDQPTERDYCYYVMFTTGTGGTSEVSNPVAALDYLLGDVSDNSTSGTGNNAVGTEDISLLGDNYGATGEDLLPVNYLDVGPTLDGWVDDLPQPDDIVDFEDLVIFALNYGADVNVVTPPVASIAAGSDALVLERPAQVALGSQVTATLRLQGSGTLRALSAKLAWDAAVVAPVGHAAGEWLTAQGGVAFSARPGTVDAAVLNTAGLTGEGVLATVTFKVLSAGDPKIRIEAVDGRDAGNRKAAVAQSQRTVAVVPTVTRLAFAQPSPFRGSTTLAFSLAQAGRVELAIYSVDGRLVRTLVSEAREPGEYREVWGGRDDAGNPMSAGVYYARLASGKVRQTRAIVYLK